MGLLAGNKPLLEKEYNRDGYIATRLKYEGDVYLYERIASREDWMEDDHELIPHYEVVIPVKYSSLLPNGKERNGHSYPADSWWGKKGWTFGSIEKAELKFNELNK